jgi:hypothetical protein
VHVIDNKVIISKIINYLIVNIVGNNDYFCFTLLCVKMAMSQCIIFHHALYYHASCYVININPMVHMYCVNKGGNFFQYDYMDKTLPFFNFLSFMFTIQQMVMYQK